MERAAKRAGSQSSTVHERFQEWERAGFFERLWQVGLAEYEEMEGVEWEWQALDGVMTKAPLGKDATGKNPTDRAKMGTKRSLLTDGAGIPLAVVVDGANRHDSKLLAATLDGIVVARPVSGELQASRQQPQHLCLDAGYDSERAREEALSRGLRATHPPFLRQGGRGRRESSSARCEGSALGRGADTFVAQSLPAAVGALGEKGRELLGVCAPCLRSAHLLQAVGFRIRTKSGPARPGSITHNAR
jgi:hypothetical protein